jgi:hypothetical protein
MINTYQLLPRTVFGQPNGNYDGSSQDFIGDAAKAANYYLGRNGVQTVTLRTSQFLGSMIVEATLDTDAETGTWFTTYEYGDSSSAVPLTDYHPVSITGNFTWIRIRVIGFEGGVIDTADITY